MTKLPYHVALVSETDEVPTDVLAPVAAAIQTQVQRDFAPAWGVSAVVAVMPDRAHAVAAGFWPVVLTDKLDDPGALGYHTDHHGQPIAFVSVAEGDWSVTVSHETLEALADPFGRRTWVAAAPDGHAEHVHILVEVCDPCESETYRIGGVEVSNFALPSWYHTAKRFGPHYDYLGEIDAPRELLRDGYVSWHDDAGHWYQQTWFSGADPETRKLGRLADFAHPGESLREAIDRVTNEYRRSL